jgi:hypothetical protein
MEEKFQQQRQESKQSTRATIPRHLQEWKTTNSKAFIGVSPLVLICWIHSFVGAAAEATNGEPMTLLPCSPRHSLGGPSGMGPQETFTSELEQLNEDPTIVQARKSMLARTGDRHARGKLPGPKEGRFLSPDALPVEPLIPNTRSSKRYTKERRRLPDVVDGVSQTESGAALKDDEHVVICRRCQTDLLVKKAAFAVRCKACGEVNPASSGNRGHQSRFTNR